jgi:hypothetical protein
LWIGGALLVALLAIALRPGTSAGRDTPQQEAGAEAIMKQLKKLAKDLDEKGTRAAKKAAELKTGLMALGYDTKLYGGTCKFSELFTELEEVDVKLAVAQEAAKLGPWDDDAPRPVSPELDRNIVGERESALSAADQAAGDVVAKVKGCAPNPPNPVSANAAFSADALKSITKRATRKKKPGQIAQANEDATDEKSVILTDATIEGCQLVEFFNALEAIDVQFRLSAFDYDLADEAQRQADQFAPSDGSPNVAGGLLEDFAKDLRKRGKEYARDVKGRVDELRRVIQLVPCGSPGDGGGGGDGGTTPPCTGTVTRNGNTFTYTIKMTCNFTWDVMRITGNAKVTGCTGPAGWFVGAGQPPGDNTCAGFYSGGSPGPGPWEFTVTFNGDPGTITAQVSAGQSGTPQDVTLTQN